MAGALLVLQTGSGGGLLGALGVQAQSCVAGDFCPGGEGVCFAGVEVGEQCQVGLGALLVGAELVAELDEFIAQRGGVQIVGDDALCDLSMLGTAACRYRAGCRHFACGGRR
ncbi:hypothetical protein [Streptomyces pristinaespiralis]|uniref:hypothetical protein n=1 Tax=Streptomyces pristinaespiralis TaxID=38300 RepID=UPI0038514F27